VTFHPVTLAGAGNSIKQFDTLLEVLDKLDDTLLIFTKPNADAECRSLAEKIDKYVEANPEKAIAFFSMGRRNYLSAMQFVDAVVGNSSSGLAEAPTFKIATINIGNRQTGRIKAASVIDCGPEKVFIEEAFQKLYSTAFQKSLKSVVNPYGEGGASEKIYQVIKTFPLETILKKQFRDL
jgi:GDP/UDP-N,N'-diacetylbacillosamine 2-epimerase (hydrolysing)